MIVWTPAEAKLAVYVAFPVSSSVTEGVDPPLLFEVPPSIDRVTFPVGNPDPLTSATVMLIASSVLELGDVVAADNVDVVAKSTVELAGHAATRFARSTDPRPVTSS